MDYKFAKQLKDAGFPHKHSMLGGNDGDSEYCFYAEFLKGEYICVPTLSELIEACGYKFDALNKIKNIGIWRASGFLDHYLIALDGSTPEEAVANLWLELNKKNDQSR